MDFKDHLNCVEEELKKWKENQRLFGNGRLPEDTLCAIQLEHEAIAKLLWQELQKLTSQVPRDIPNSVYEKLPLSDDINRINTYLEGLVKNAFIVEKQPPRVIKINTEFSATVKFLLGSTLDVCKMPPQVKVSILSEEQASAFLAKPKAMPEESAGEVLNNTGTMEYFETSNELKVTFQNMKLETIKRPETEEKETITVEKFAFLFHSQINVGEGKLTVEAWALSVPVVVISHANQEPLAWATIIWGNAFVKPGQPFLLYKHLTWDELDKVLENTFEDFTECPLSFDELAYLARKLFRSSRFVESFEMVTWPQFCEEPLPEFNFTFWDWFYAAMKVTEEHLKPLQKDGLIIGFIGRPEAEELLFQQSEGTFLIRFSDSVLGGVTIAFVEKSSTTKKRIVSMIQPFTSKDFIIRPLADRIRDNESLQFLYPSIPKYKAFWKHYQTRPGSK